MQQLDTKAIVRLAMRLGYGGLLLICCLFAVPAGAQKSAAPRKSAAVQSLETLASRLTRDCGDDSCKAYRIFKWIADNIAYDVATYSGKKDAYLQLPPAPLSLSAAEHDSWYNRQVAEMVLRTRSGICDGYARLYLELARLAGLEVVKVEGYGKTDTAGLPTSINHAWNAVKVAGNWKLLDACWGSGYLLGRHFVRAFEPYYFDTPPQSFIRDHYPATISWSLLKSPPPQQEFFEWPVFYPAYTKAGISSYFPRSGFLRLRKDSTVILRLIGADSVVIPDIYIGNAKGEIESVFESPVAEDRSPPVPVVAKASFYKKPVISKAQRSAIDAIMAFADTATVDPEGPGVSKAAAEPEKKEPPVYRTYRNVFEYRFKVPAGVTDLYFYHEGDAVLRYTVEVLD